MTVKQISKDLRALANATVATHSQRFFKTGEGEYGEGDRFLGIRVPVLRAQIKKYHDTPLSAIEKLLKSTYHEERLFALLLLVNQFNRGNETERAAIFRIYLNSTAHINNWDLVDSSAPNIVGAYLTDKDRRVIHKLSRSKNLWDRRIAVMSTFHFIKLNQFDDLIALGVRLMRDKEDLIHKAIGWMLRETGKRDSDVLKRFLDHHYNEMPRTMLRYAIERLPESERRRYLDETA